MWRTSEGHVHLVHVPEWTELLDVSAESLRRLRALPKREQRELQTLVPEPEEAFVRALDGLPFVADDEARFIERIPPDRLTLSLPAGDSPVPVRQWLAEEVGRAELRWRLDYISAVEEMIDSLG